MFFGEPPYFPIGKETPLNPPLSGGQKALPLRRIPPKEGVCCRCPPDKGDPPEGGRGFFFGEPPCFPIGKETPLNPPLSGGQKLSPFGRVRPEEGRFVAVVPLIRGIPPKGGGGLFFGEPPYFPIGKEPPLNPPLSGGQKALPLRRIPPKEGVCCRYPPDKGEYPRRGGGGFFWGSPLLHPTPPYSTLLQSHSKLAP